jgi:glycosyltransferase involved in cell wall biosynthesis
VVHPDAPAKARLALVHYTATPVVGGVERVLGAQARLLRQAGYRVRVIAGRSPGALVPELDSRHPDVERLTRRLQEGSALPREVEALQRRIERRLRPLVHGCDLVVAHNMLTMPFNLPATCALLELGLPLLAWTHDVCWAEERYVAFRRQEWPYLVLGRRHPRVTYVAVSEARRRDLAQGIGIPAEEILVVPNGIDPGEFAGLGEGARRLLEWAGGADADPLVLVPQRVTPNKRLELALDAAHHARTRHPDLQVVVTGPTDPHDVRSLEYGRGLLRRREALGLRGVFHFLFEMGAADGVHPVGPQEVAELYRVSDVVLFLGRNEGFGLPLLEAALARVPAICPDIEPFAEVAGELVHRLPVDPTPEEVAAALETALAEPAVRRRRAVLRRYAWSRVEGQLEEAIVRALGGDRL